jgi:hypothetical protein
LTYPVPHTALLQPLTCFKHLGSLDYLCLVTAISAGMDKTRARLAAFFDQDEEEETEKSAPVRKVVSSVNTIS